MQVKVTGVSKIDPIGQLVESRGNSLEDEHNHRAD